MHRSEGDSTGLWSSMLNDGLQLLEVLGVPYCRRRPSLVYCVPSCSSVFGLVSLDYRGYMLMDSSMLFYNKVDCLYPNVKEIYCEDFRLLDKMSIACGLYVLSSARAVTWRLHPHHSILSHEGLIAIIRSLSWFRLIILPNWVCSYSLRALQVIISPTGTCSDLVIHAQRILMDLNRERVGRLQWNLAHAEIWRNERADAVVKLGHGLDHWITLPELHFLVLIYLTFLQYN